MADTSADGRDHDWPAQIADKVVDIVGQVRDKTTGRAITAARIVVFGIAALVIALVAITFALIGLFRLVDVYLPGKAWSAYLLFGGIFTAVGLLLLSRRKPVAGEH